MRAVNPWSLSLLVLAHLCLAPACAATAADCPSLLRQHRAAALQLDYQAFDQTEGQGFRILAAAACPREAADLIEEWLSLHADAPSSVTWHLAQMRAESGETAAALVAARQVIRADEPADAPFKWNDYVRAIIAFLEHDRAAFDRHHAAVRAGADQHPGNAMNAGFLDRFAAHFDRSYLEAVQLGAK